MEDRRFRRSPDVVWRNVGRDVLLAPPGVPGYELLTGAGGQLWRELAGAPTVAELTGALAVLFGVPSHDILADVEQMVRTLAAQQLVEPTDGL
ncbi:MAG: PqqD family protein [Actinobacteria bacterium]|nr:PqqD family protein [Actinomycetota bacterium]